MKAQKFFLLALITILGFSILNFAFADQIVITKDDRKVLLKDDRTWEYVKEDTKAEKNDFSPESLGLTEAQIKKVGNYLPQLQLAQKKSDLDGIYLALSNIKIIVGTSEKIDSSLSKVERTIELNQKIAEYQATHDHEMVVQYADMLLDLFPNHVPAKRALKESGLIFFYLQDAQRSVENIFTRDKQGEVRVVKETNEDGESSIDLSKVFYEIVRGKESVAEAKKLDPQFEPAIELEKMLNGTGDTLVYLVASDMVNRAAQTTNSRITFFYQTYSFLASSIGLYGASEAWEKIEPIVTESEKLKHYIELAQKQSQSLSQYNSEDTNLLVQHTKELAIELVSLHREIHNPTGSLMDYKQSVVKHKNNIETIIVKISSVVPSKGKLSESITGFGKTVIGYSIFKQETTKPILEEHESLIRA